MTPELLRDLLSEAEELAERHADDRSENRACGSYDAELDCLKCERSTRSVIRKARKVLLKLEGENMSREPGSRIKKFTVLLLYPDYMNDGGHETFMTHVEARNVKSAENKAQKEAASFEGNSACNDVTDFAVISVIEGHLQDIKS